MAKFVSKTYRLAHMSLHYLQANPRAKRTVIIIHNVLGDHRGLMGLGAVLAKQKLRVIVLDLPGYGQSTPLKISHNIENLGTVVAKLILHLKLSGVVLIGHSSGGNIALATAAQLPKQVGNVVLLATPAEARGLALRAAGIYYKLYRRLPISKRDLWLAHHFIIRHAHTMLYVARSDLHQNELVQASKDAATSLNPRVVGEISHSLDKINQLSQAKEVKNKVLIIASGRDRYVPTKSMKKLKSVLPKAKMVTLPNAGHMAPIDAPAEVAQTILDYLTSTSSGS